MKKQLLTLALGVASLGAFSQSTIWQPYNSNLDTSTYVRYLSVVDTNTVWGLSGSSHTLNKFTRTIDGANFHANNFLPDTLTYAASGISAVNANTAWISTYFKAASGTAGQVLKTTNGGNTWANVATAAMFNGANNFPDWVHFYDVNNGIVLGDPNGCVGGVKNATDMFEIYRTHDGGTTWSRVDSLHMPVPQAGEFGLTSSYTTYKHFVWFGSSIGNVYMSADSGKTWMFNMTSPNFAGGVTGLAFRDSVHGLAYGVDGAGVAMLAKTADGGMNWAVATQGTNVGINAISSIPKTKGFMSVGVDSALTGYLTSVTYDDGATWTILESGTTNPTRMLSLQMLDSLNGWAGNFSTNALPYGVNGVNRFKLGHKLGCPITVTTASSSTPFNVCLGSAITLTASGLNTYTWSTSATTASVSVSPTVTTSYSVAGTTTAGCANYENFNVNVISGTVTTTAPSHTICPGVPLTITVSGATTYSWSPATGLTATTGASVAASPTATTSYTITGVKAQCPLNPATVNVVTKPIPSLTLTASTPTLCATGGVPATITATGTATSYTWSTAANTATISVTPTVTTTYTLSATNTVNTCAAKATITETVVVCTGIENYSSNANVNVYPNPSNGLVTLSLTDIKEGTVMYVTNLIGQEVVKVSIKDVTSNFDFSYLQKGVYTLTVVSGQSKSIAKLIIQ
ncbi:MAG: T9SS type A sorting domain-containing protein [Bacteroidia bacterium]